MWVGGWVGVFVWVVVFLCCVSVAEALRPPLAAQAFFPESLSFVGIDGNVGLDGKRRPVGTAHTGGWSLRCEYRTLVHNGEWRRRARAAAARRGATCPTPPARPVRTATTQAALAAAAQPGPRACFQWELWPVSGLRCRRTRVREAASRGFGCARAARAACQGPLLTSSRAGSGRVGRCHCAWAAWARGRRRAGIEHPTSRSLVHMVPSKCTCMARCEIEHAEAAAPSRATALRLRWIRRVASGEQGPPRVG